jgi:hypothetical protein
MKRSRRVDSRYIGSSGEQRFDGRGLVLVNGVLQHAPATRLRHSDCLANKIRDGLRLAEARGPRQRAVKRTARRVSRESFERRHVANGGRAPERRVGIGPAGRQEQE